MEQRVWHGAVCPGGAVKPTEAVRRYQTVAAMAEPALRPLPDAAVPVTVKVSVGTRFYQFLGALMALQTLTLLVVCFSA